MGFKVETITQVAALAVIGAVCAAVVKKQVPDLALALTLCAVAMVLTLGMTALKPIRVLMDTLADRAGLSAAVLAPVLKTLGISILSRITSELCRDAGERGLAAAVEVTAGVCALLVCLPLFEAVLGVVLDLL